MILKYNHSSYINLNCVKHFQLVCIELSNDPKNPEPVYKMWLAVDDGRYKTPLKNLTEDECKEVITLFESALDNDWCYFNLCQEFSFTKERTLYENA